ncbi:hypothetical protein [Actinomadura litoris]|uniref:hypothetical protein n=1 Tax=Actinomadura litoris TaxID=2678616 RepID=UPI001FE8FEF9|nr:hypothetical protein [Actinomadura litoris]
MAAIAHRPTWMTRLNAGGHRTGLNVFFLIVLGHWAEHLVQAYQIWVLGRPVPESRGILGQWFPWLIKSEGLHYGFAVVMLVAFILLRPGFSGRSRTWWNIALGIQVWHHFEHLLLLIQAQSGHNIGGRAVPTSIIQLLVPRVELHLFYNAVVFAPMVVAMLLHRRDAAAAGPGGARSCDCAVARA